MTLLLIIVLGCGLPVVATSLQVRLDAPPGRPPFARTIVINHVQAVKGELALPKRDERSSAAVVYLSKGTLFHENGRRISGYGRRMLQVGARSTSRGSARVLKAACPGLAR